MEISIFKNKIFHNHLMIVVINFIVNNTKITVIDLLSDL